MKQLVILLLLISAPAHALKAYSSSKKFAQVIQVTASQKSDSSWCFETSVRHDDQGWAHYADRWEVIDLKGNNHGLRTLLHPHDNEQPFTRSLCDIKIPPEITKVIVRAKCNKHGFGGKSVIVDLIKRRGDGYIVRKN